MLDALQNTQNETNTLHFLHLCVFYFRCLLFTLYLSTLLTVFKTTNKMNFDSSATFPEKNKN